MSETHETATAETAAPVASAPAPTPYQGTDPLPTPEVITEAIKEVIDPEIGINIVDLGLIYEVFPDPDTHHVTVNMTLTSPGCPAGPELTSAVWMTVKRLPGVADCDVKLIWSPRWDPQVHASEEGRMYLGIW